MSLENLTEKFYTATARTLSVVNDLKQKYFDISSEDYYGFKYANLIYKFNEEIFENPRKYFTSTSAMLAPNHLTRGFLERYVAGVSPENSFNMRELGISATYGGIGLLLYEGLHISRNLFKIKEKHSEKAYAVHDTLYFLAADLLLNPIFYSLAGEDDPLKIIIASVVNAAASLPNGYVGGYAIDISKDLMGIEPSDRLPKFLQNAPSSLKKTVFVGGFGAAMGLSSLFY